MHQPLIFVSFNKLHSQTFNFFTIAMNVTASGQDPTIPSITNFYLYSHIAYCLQISTANALIRKYNERMEKLWEGFISVTLIGQTEFEIAQSSYLVMLSYFVIWLDKVIFQNKYFQCSSYLAIYTILYHTIITIITLLCM